MKQISFIFIMLSTLFSGCDYLEMVPEKDIETIETIFEKREEVEDWFKTCYVFLTNPISSVIVSPAYTGTDEVVAGDYTRKMFGSDASLQWNGLYIGDGLQMSQEPYANIWKKNEFYAALRYCNIFLEKIDGVYNMLDEEKKLWTAEIQALKAHYYFELMRRYGPIVLVPENIAANSEIEAMQQPRSSIDSCVNTILSLLDEAMKVLPPLLQKDQSRWAYYSLEAAATLKAQVLLLDASLLFNGNQMYANFTNKKGELLFSQTYDHEKWKKAALAADEALQLCLAQGKRLCQGSASKGSDLLNVMLDIENSVLGQNFKNDEAIFMLRPQYHKVQQWYNYILPYFKSSDYVNYNENCKGCISPSMKMVEMYYTERGLPIDADKQWDASSRYQMSKETNPQYRDVVPLNDTDVLSLHLRREPRFYAHIAADRCYWQRGRFAYQNLIVEAYEGELFGSQRTSINNSVPQNLSGYWIKKGTYSNVSTVEYKNVDSREEATIVTRLAELYLMKAEAWNEYEGPLQNRTHVYEPLNAVRKRAGIPDVETSWSYSKNPEKATTKEGMREIIRQEWNIEFAFEGKRFWNLRRWLTAQDELNTKLYGWNILGKDAQQFYNNFEGPVVVWSKRKFIAPRDYLFPIRSEEVLISGCVQNPGW